MANYEVMSLFDCFTSMEELKPSFKPLKLLSLFSGIGAFEKALDRITTPYELVAFCEIDEHAARSYCAIHGVAPSQNLGDITKVDGKALPKDIDVVTYGFPCQDISLAGNQKGLFNADGTKTRSGLFFDALRIIEETKPRVAIAENVKNLTGKKFREQFRIVLDSLTDAGYKNYYTVLNAKHFGVPQNRERVFIVSIRNDLDSGFFTFPKGFPLERRLQDLLEPEVDEKYYLSAEMMEYLTTISETNKERGNGNQYSPADLDGVSKAITTKKGQRVKDNFIEEPAVRQIGNLIPSKRKNPNQGRLYDSDGLSPTLGTMQGGNRQPFVLAAEPQVAKGQQNWTGSFVSPDIDHLEKSTTIGGNEPVKIHLNGGGCLTSDDNITHLRVRKLTPKECFRLMGFDDADFFKAEAVNSNTQLYKQAGNSIVVDVLEHLWRKLIDSGVFNGR